MTYKEYLEMVLEQLILTQNRGDWAGICVHNRILCGKLESRGCIVEDYRIRLFNHIVKDCTTTHPYLDGSFWWRAKHGYVGHVKHLTRHMRMEMRIRYIRKLIQKEKP